LFTDEFISLHSLCHFTLLNRFMIGQYVTLSGDVISHFNVTSCSSEDSAEISCNAKNDLGSIVHKARLNIFGKRGSWCHAQFDVHDTGLNSLSFKLQVTITNTNRPQLLIFHRASVCEGLSASRDGCERERLFHQVSRGRLPN